MFDGRKSNDERKDQRMRRMTGFMTVLALGLALTAAQAKSRKPNATLRLSGGSVAAGVGVDWASGTLTYQGKHYPVSVRGCPSVTSASHRSRPPARYPT